MSKIGAVVFDHQEGYDDLVENPDYPTDKSDNQSCEKQDSEKPPF